MNITATSGAYASSHSQRLLASLLQQSDAAGKNQPSGQAGPADGAPPAGGPPPGPPPGGGARAFASNTLASLLSVQEQSQGANPIDKLMSSADADGDGSLSIDEIKATLGGQAGDALSAAVSKLDADGDGKLSSSELTSALEARHKTHGGGRARPSSDELAAKLISDADGDQDGSLSLDEVKSALSDKDGDAVTDGFGKLDKDGDGKLNATELSSALSAVKAATGRYAQAQALTEATAA